MSVSLFHGTDAVALDKALLARKKQYQEVLVFEADSTESALADSLLTMGLFADKKLLVFHNFLLRQVNRGKFSQKVSNIASLINQQEESEDIVFVEADSAKVKYYKQLFPRLTAYEFTVPLYVFRFIDNFYPNNARQVFDYLQKAQKTTAPELLFYFLKKRVQELIAIAAGASGKKQAWQEARLKKQLAHWGAKRLVALYKTLYRIEEGIKTGKTPYTIAQSLDMLVVLYT